MIKINVQDIIKVLTIDEQGVCEDGTNRSWVRCSALSFFDDKETPTYITLFAFGYTADMVIENHTGENMRRAFVSGSLEIEENYEIVKKEFNGVKKSFKLPKMSYKLIADTLKFIDRFNDGEGQDVEVLEASDEDEIIDLTTGTATKTTAASSEGNTNTTGSTRKRRERRERR